MNVKLLKDIYFFCIALLVWLNRRDGLKHIVKNIITIVVIVIGI